MDDFDDNEDDNERRRDRDRRIRRELGARAGALARTFMQLKPARLAKLELEDATREAIERAQAVKTRSARRRAERELAGHLRGVELGVIETQLETVQKSERANARLFQAAEAWRERLISEGEEAAAEFHEDYAGLDPDHWATLIENAKRQKTHGKPKGAARLLFQAIIHVLEAE